MNLNRCLIGFVILTLGALSFLSFSSPQRSKWVYMWQAYVLQVPPGSGYGPSLDMFEEDNMGDFDNFEFEEVRGALDVPMSFVGFWWDWDSNGDLFQIRQFDPAHPGDVKVIFNQDGCDRRREFGLTID